MKTLILFFSMIVSQITFAGTGGGGVMMAALSQDSEIVYHIGEQDGVVKFAHGQLVQGQWEVQEMSLQVDALVEKAELINAITESQLKNDWVQLK